MTINKLLEGKKVRHTKSGYCSLSDGIYAIVLDPAGAMMIRSDTHSCHQTASWELLDPIRFNPPKHEHEFKCECGEIKT